MKLCRIKGDLSSEIADDRFTDIVLCDFEADVKRGDDAQVISFEEYTSNKHVQCEVCYKSLEGELDEKRVSH